MSLKKKTFKQRIRKNDMKQRHQIGFGLRKRMGAARRIRNRYDSVDDGTRPMEMIVSEIAEGTAVPSQEAVLDPRSLTDLLLRPAESPVSNNSASASANVATTSCAVASKSNGCSSALWKRGSSKSSALLTSVPLASEKVLPSLPLAPDDPLALPDTRVFEEEERQQRLAREAAARQNENKNLYRHSGQPYLFWERVGLHPALLQALRDLHFTHPTPVQEEVLPNVLASGDEGLARQRSSEADKKSKKHKRAGGAADSAGHDVVVSAETGSGKTLVFALPILQDLLTTLDTERVSAVTPTSSAEAVHEKATGQASSDAAVARAELKAKRQKRIMHSLIISPTRELALQIDAAIRQLTKFAPQVVVGCVVGGMAQERQQRVLNRHPHILICTPGRLWDLVQKNEGCYLGHSASRRLHYVVLDEADKMLQSGRFAELQTLLERIHCEVLPAGFAQDREEGAEPGEIAVESGRWDPDTESFIPFDKEEAGATKPKVKKLVAETVTEAGGAPVETMKGKKRAREAMEAAAEDVSSTSKTKKAKKVTADVTPAKSRKTAKTSAKQAAGLKEEEDEEAADEEETASKYGNINTETEHGGARHRKDEPQPIPMPPEPAAGHRVITYVTSATLSLQTNYERRDFSARKSIIRTSNADVLTKVLQQLEIKLSNARVFSLAESANVAARINETYLRCPDNSKDLYLYYFLKTYHDDRAIVFVNAISMLRRLVKLLEVLGIAVVGLHASMQQRQRLKFIDKFKEGKIHVLVATDVASRGLDIDGLKYVVHYQVPRTTEAYIHRCGRTARCGGTGLSVLLVNAQEHMSFRKLMESLGRKESEVETFAMQATIVHQLHSHLRIAWQIDKLQKEIGKSRANNQWVNRMTKEADLETDDMFDDTADAENREKQKAIRILQRELQLLGRKFTGQYGGKGAFRTSAYALGAKQAEQHLKERADRQTIRVASKKKKFAADGKK
ncbi:ATP-dependent RNA helicase-like protein [Leishmania major strain Friedlin]|uniref:ATP-dependent RNA helicase n=1 Tax=Leishmania major TaxID=5664 RepID=Q4Q0X4_LEIMA|nr:ATP-dependent RNA helicase-like protein [Leishmania major strain Friedlin]CAG9583987.1 ATP-dependent_DEAD/H_RNA_helicase_-_putative [Leishmania major strain Friedlin]CAJ09407.1 ATP-dependent RNA helicase-like protein [Leishmania major strain Friedlin]|eukprot:XP_001687024.1 ATP-dependent RNA helicase-like protein [Leishmania major strain Friedlin]